MAETVTNLKVRFGADTKNFKADLESGKAAVDNFAGGAKDAFSEFASVFGVNMGEVSAQFSTMQKSLNLLTGAFKTSAAGTGVLTTALKALRIAFMLTGIGTLIIGLISLVSYFTKTERGAEAVERVMAGFKATINVLIDRFSTLGEGIYKLFTGDFKGGWEAMKKSVQGVGTEIVNETRQAVQLERDLQALEDREIALIEVQGRRRQSIEELRLKAKDLSLTEEERRKALAEAIQTQKAMTADEVALQKERVRIQEAQLNMGEKMDDDVRALAESKAKLNDIEAEGTSGVRSMMREYNSLTKSINEATQAEKIAAVEKEKAYQKAIQNSKISNSKGGIKINTEWQLITDSKGNKSWSNAIINQLDTDKLEAKSAKIKSIYGDLKTSIMDFSSVFQNSMADAAAGFGETIGKMLAGSAGFSDLASFVGSTLGDMAIQVGKIAIATGFAVSGIKVALQSLNPVIAIAAGAVLVGLGTWAKSALGSAASGGSSTYSSAASTSSYGATSGSGASTNIRSAPQTIYITGEFRQRGPDLVAVIDKNTQRRVIGT